MSSGVLVKPAPEAEGVILHRYARCVRREVAEIANAATNSFL